ncbi:MAG TPA: acyltransferase family protein, partial [Sphingomicrobium sp.]
LIGRIDQFVVGMLFARWEPGKATWWLVGGLYLFYAAFDATGGYYGKSNWAMWVILPTFEAFGFAALIRWYDARPLSGNWLKPVEAAGKYSYSIYLLHLFVIRDVANYVNDHLVKLTNIFIVLPFATAFFAVMLVAGHYTYKWVEEPFLRRRRPYLLKEDPLADQAPAGALAATR